jgi:uncharacterized membrane protein HdeD (DUF308 family)
MSLTTFLTNSLWFPITIHGLLVALIGLLAIALPQYATLTIEIVLGLALLVVAGLSIATYLSVMLYDGSEWILLWGVVAAIAGGLILWHPDFAAFSLAIVITAYITMHGALAIAAAVELREYFPHSWGWVMTDGIINLALASAIFIGLPENSMWTIGTLLGISLLVFGGHLVAFGLMLRRLMDA